MFTSEVAGARIVDPIKSPEMWADSIWLAADIFHRRLGPEHGGFALVGFGVEERQDLGAIKVVAKVFPLEGDSIKQGGIVKPIVGLFRECVNLAFISKTETAMDQVINENDVELLEISTELLLPNYEHSYNSEYFPVAMIKMAAEIG